MQYKRPCSVNAVKSRSVTGGLLDELTAGEDRQWFAGGFAGVVMSTTSDDKVREPTQTEPSGLLAANLCCAQTRKTRTHWHFPERPDATVPDSSQPNKREGLMPPEMTPSHAAQPGLGSSPSCLPALRRSPDFSQALLASAHSRACCRARI